MGSGFSFHIRIFEGAGAFGCGEETTLLTSIEGRRGQPRLRLPYPAERGLFGKPTVINSVEAWANVPLIIEHGADWFGSFGTKNSPGTKIFSLTGNVLHTGLLEVPMGLTLREINEIEGCGRARATGPSRSEDRPEGAPLKGCSTRPWILTPFKGLGRCNHAHRREDGYGPLGDNHP